ncbi:MAG: carbamoyl phosphate synthase small subunit [Deltaproteobacteria bacterium]|nr:MAG: carbamoyl phosphate synthase small subunit [Deltaproteobacteria bacterium]
MKALLALEDGRVFPCSSFTGPGEVSGEVVFNTSMTGYQEILTDPSYKGQLVTLTCPLIGNYGTTAADTESDRIQAEALLVREYQPIPSNFRSQQPLADYLNAQGVMGVDNLDTRAVTRHIRMAGAMRAILSTHIADADALVAKARAIPSMEGLDLASQVQTQTPYVWTNGHAHPLDEQVLTNAGIWPQQGKKPRVAALDFGIKHNILRCLDAAGCDVLVVPGDTSPDTLRSIEPDGIFLSNGPGDPAPVTYAAETVKALAGFRPMFGICLGFQIMGLALGAKTFKLKFGHRGGNQPVQNLATGHVEVTSQNHGFAVDEDSLAGLPLEVTHINLNDRTLEGFRHTSLPMFAVQYHPEASPGPHDAHYLFREFVEMMTNGQ